MTKLSITFVVRRAEAPEEWARDEAGRPIDPGTGEALPDPDSSRLADSIETALRLGEGVVVIAPAPRDGEQPAFPERRFSERYSCPYDGTTIDELEPRSFSFNSPHGACPTCTGLGTQLVIDPDLIITPGVFVQRIVHVANAKKHIEQRTVRKRA